MHAELVLLAEGAAAHGPHPAVFGVGAFVILMSLLGITFLFSGVHQRPSAEAKTVAEVEREHGGHS
ncbi:MAG: hypothetical protein Q4G21_11210 [Dermabacter sp.]|nr:hypothetical protein [Dermabacter sp.]